MKSYINTQIDTAWTAFRSGWQLLRREGPGQVQFWFIALAVGIASGFAALFFRKGIEGLQAFLYGTDDVQLLHTFAQSLPVVLDIGNTSRWWIAGWFDFAQVHARRTGAQRC